MNDKADTVSWTALIRGDDPEKSHNLSCVYDPVPLQTRTRIFYSLRNCVFAYSRDKRPFVLGRAHGLTRLVDD